MSTMSTVDIINPPAEALAYMRKHGWTQGTWLAADGSVCLLGAMRGASWQVKRRVFRNWMGEGEASIRVINIRWQKAYALLESVCQEQYGHDVPHVNDRLLTCQEEAEALLEKAAARWEEQVT